MYTYYVLMISFCCAKIREKTKLALFSVLSTTTTQYYQGV